MYLYWRTVITRKRWYFVPLRLASFSRLFEYFVQVGEGASTPSLIFAWLPASVSFQLIKLVASTERQPLGLIQDGLGLTGYRLSFLVP